MPPHSDFQTVSSALQPVARWHSNCTAAAMLAKTFSATHQGLEGSVIRIEGALQRALPKIHITGLPSDVIRESGERVKACLGGLGFNVPSERVVIHLSPAQARKHGSQLDLAIAIAVLKTEGLLKEIDLARTAFLGELSLDAILQPVGGAVALLQALANHSEVDRIILPGANGWEASLVGSPKVRIANTLVEVLDALHGRAELPAAPQLRIPELAAGQSQALDRVLGQKLAKRALQIALAGRHHLLFLGPPGVGKSLLASCAPDLLPPLELEEWLEVIKARGIQSGGICDRRRPFRSPHHSISGAALLGGGSGTIVPGEVTLAHHGVLFLDEFPEFRKDVIEGLREPLQSGTIHLHRIGVAVSLPAQFTLIAAMNPCPCGYSLGSSRRCACPPDRVLAYRRKTSGPILDRMDLSVLLSAPKGQVSSRPGPSHREVAESIARVWLVQGQRADSMRPLDRSDPNYALSSEAGRWVEELTEREELSFRALHKLLRVARTIADLAERPAIELADLQESWSLRCPEFYRTVYA